MDIDLWNVRLHSFEKAFQELNDKITRKATGENQEKDIVNNLKLTLELGWQLMHYYLEEKGFVFKANPEDTFRQAELAGIIDFGQELTGMFANPNLHSGKTSLKELKTLIKDDVLPLLEKLNLFFSDSGDIDGLGLFDAN